MQTQVDLLIIGSSINGTGIAHNAAGRGLSIALCKQGDLVDATSSASSKLIHGGLAIWRPANSTWFMNRCLNAKPCCASRHT